MGIFFRLPSAEDRREGLFPMRWITKNFDLQQDLHYMLYTLIDNVICLGFVILVFVWGSYFVGVGVGKHTLALPQVFSRIMFWPTILMILFSYLRIKSNINIRYASLPFYQKARYLNWISSWSRRKWIYWSFLILLALPVCLYWSYIYVVRLTLHFNMEESSIFTFLLMLTQVVGTGFIAGLMILYAATFEKALNFYSEFKAQLTSLHRDNQL